jgi:predicted aspartyl protease
MAISPPRRGVRGGQVYQAAHGGKAIMALAPTRANPVSWMRSRKECRMLRRTAHMLAMLACAAALTAPRPAAAAAERCAPQLRAELNVDTHGAPLVTLTINGAVLHLLLDTGAERTTLTEETAQRLGLPADFARAQTVQGIGGNVAAGVVRPDPQGAGGPLAKVAFAVVPGHLPPVGDRQVDGLLGADLLAAYDLDLDIGHHLILLYDPPACTAPALPWSRTYDAVDAQLLHHRLIAFPITLDGHRLTAVIDTGAQLSVIDTDATSRLGLTDAVLRQDETVEMQGVSAQPVTAREHRFARLGMADEVLLSPRVAVTPLRLADADLLMGTDVLMRERIWVSFATRRIYVARPE